MILWLENKTCFLLFFFFYSLKPRVAKELPSETMSLQKCKVSWKWKPNSWITNRINRSSRIGNMHNSVKSVLAHSRLEFVSLGSSWTTSICTFRCWTTDSTNWELCGLTTQCNSSTRVDRVGRRGRRTLAAEHGRKDYSTVTFNLHKEWSLKVNQSVWDIVVTYKKRRCCLRMS